METIEVLNQCTVEGMVVKLPNINLERKDYESVKKKLEGIGGKWKGGKVAGFVFASDPSVLLYELCGGATINLKKEYQFFATPPLLADRLVRYAELTSTDTVLEPSAGQGAIIRSINEATDIVPDCYELMDTNVSVLEKSGLSFNLLGRDFLLHDGKRYSKIIANPPFSGNQDIDHVMKMYSTLEEGGVLVSVTGESWTFGSQKKQKDFRDFLKDLGALVLDIEKGTFKESGTMAGGKIVIFQKP